MSLWSRIANVFRTDRVRRELDEELESHVAEAIAAGRAPDEARRALGVALRHRERSLDVKLLPWLDGLRADAIFAVRRLRKTPVTTAAAMLSLALAMGACTAAFRIVDAVLLRPLPIAAPERSYVVVRAATAFSRDGEPHVYDEVEYPLFRRMRAAVKDRAEVLAISAAQRIDLTYRSDQETEKAWRQYVSGRTFASFGLQPALGRLFTDADDQTPGAHPYAVISHDYWMRRFAGDPHVIGRALHIGRDTFEIVGVVEPRFTGTETGTMTDLFVPTMMHPSVNRDDATWARAWVRLDAAAAAGGAASVGQMRDRLQAVLRSFQEGRARGFTDMARDRMEKFIGERLTLESAATGVSYMQKANRRALAALGVLVLLVLLIACANVANLMTAQAAARAREMALRVSIGAGRGRLVQLVLVESFLIAAAAATLGALFAWWAAPFVVGLINPPDTPARLALPADWRVLGFGLALTLGVTALFGLLPALRASAVRPVSALKGGDDAHARRRVMHGLIAAQVAFCVLVLFIAGLFVVTFQRLSQQPTGFVADRLLALDTVAATPQPPVFWAQVADHLRALPGVEQVAICGWPLLNGLAWNGFIATDDGAPMREELAFFLAVSPGWVETMKIPLVRGRDFRATDTAPGAAIVNETFVKTYFRGENPIGRWFEKGAGGQRFEVIGVVRDVAYRQLRERILPVVFVPFQQRDLKAAAGSRAVMPESRGTFIVRSAGADPLAIAAMLRQEIPRARAELRVSNLRTQTAINAVHTVRERLLATLAAFFACVALALAAIGLHGVLHYSVLQRRREIGIRIALGARAGHVARGVTMALFAVVTVGAIAGLMLGLLSARHLDALFYHVQATDAAMIGGPALLMLAIALLAALPAVLHAVRIDPVKMLRRE